MTLNFKRFENIKSTNDEAIKLIKKDFTKPTLILTKKQTKGRGTMGKKWISKKGNIFLSIFFEFNPKKINFRQYAILNAYLIKKILKKYSLKSISIKWPNDLLIEKRKVCGILQEVIQHKNKDFLIIGVGINTYSSPKNISFRSSCLRDYSKKKVDNKEILKDIKKYYEKFIHDTHKYKFDLLKKKVK